ncbi:hypothetical protein, partial [Rhizobium favelukesii]|uniref:hypothetical protein n=1 Tax=Rhizobium favelukesii TaxID=348824 RepID=UPI001A92BBC4
GWGRVELQERSKTPLGTNLAGRWNRCAAHILELCQTNEIPQGPFQGISIETSGWCISKLKPKGPAPAVNIIVFLLLLPLVCFED